MRIQGRSPANDQPRTAPGATGDIELGNRVVSVNGIRITTTSSGTPTSGNYHPGDVNIDQNSGGTPLVEVCTATGNPGTWVTPGIRQIVSATGNADYTTTSTTFVDVDATNQAVTLTTAGGDVLLLWSGSVVETVNGGDAVIFTLTRDGTDISGGAGLSYAVHNLNITQRMNFMYRDVAPSAGAHTYKLQWRVGAHTFVLYGATIAPPQLIAVEVRH